MTAIPKELKPTCKTNKSPSPALNTSKYNKNLINFVGILVLALFSFVLGFSIIGSRMGWVDLRYGGKYDLYMFLNLCFLPIVLPIIYFLFRPKYFTNAIKCLKDM